MSVILDPDIPFHQLLEDVGSKFRESAKFWGCAQMTLTLEGRKMMPEEELLIVDAITVNSQLDIICILDTDANRIARCEKALTERLMELSGQTGQFYKGDLQKGDILESEASIVIIGDVSQGAKVIAKGNIIVLGVLQGAAHAGAAGNQNAVIVALDMAPTQIRIAGCSTKTEEKGKRLGRGSMIASAEGREILIRPLKKNFLNYLNFI